jgi:hypothetical protein
MSGFRLVRIATYISATCMYIPAGPYAILDLIDREYVLALKMGGLLVKSQWVIYVFFKEQEGRDAIK